MGASGFANYTLLYIWMQMQSICIAFALHVDYKTVERLVNNYGLFANDGENMWSDSVLKRLDKRKDISDKRKQAAIARWRQNLDNQRQTTIQDGNEETSGDTQAMQMQSTSNANAKHKQCKCRT